MSALALAAPLWHSSRLVYRAYGDDDIDLTQEIQRDPMTLLGVSGQALPQGRAWAEAIGDFSKNSIICVIVCLPISPDQPTKAGKRIGRAMLRPTGPPNSVHRDALFGVVFLKEYQSAGYGTEALEWLFDCAFNRFGLHRIEGHVYAWNMAARGSYKKLGFKEEVVYRKQMWMEGEFRDVIGLGLLEHEWRERQAKKVSLARVSK